MGEDTLTAASIDPREAEYYRRLAATWWDPAGPFWPLHRLNAVRAGYIATRMDGHFGPGRSVTVLDVGCGGGILSEAVAGAGHRVTGIDVVAKNIATARSHGQLSPGLDLTYDVVTVEELASRGTRFDVVLNMEVVEHVADLPGFLAACAALVAPGGLMFVATINRTVRSWLFAIVGAEYVLRWLPRGTHRWRRFPRPAELEDLLAPHGLAVSERVGVRVNPVTRHFALTPSTAVNYMLCTRRLPAAHPPSQESIP